MAKPDDGEAAFAIATPDIQSIFRTPETFMKMVVNKYPQIYRLRKISFLGLVTKSQERLNLSCSMARTEETRWLTI